MSGFYLQPATYYKQQTVYNSLLIIPKMNKMIYLFVRSALFFRHAGILC